MVAVAALYDVHGNPPALEAALARVGDATLVFGGDLAWGPMPAEAVDRIRALDALAIRGNADRDPGDDWVVDQLGGERLEWLQSLPVQLELDVAGLGRVLFVHGSPRSDEEMLLRTASDERLRTILDGIEADVVVCGHTHMQFDRRAGDKRVVNAGSVGLPYGAAGAHWVELGPDVRHRRAEYDPSPLASSTWPRASEILAVVESPPSEAEAIAEFEALIAAGRDATLIQ
ncbi:MAG TPA: metallophosphoesterase family protein [Gaiellaceae bacterium]|nr:metallophosphoesterase family protein [Gaiellaceae bacterium]